MKNSHKSILESMEDNYEPMNIYSSPGTKIMFEEAGGYEGDRKQAKRSGLEKGRIYTVLKTNVDSYSSTVELVEVPGPRFNTVMFSPASRDCLS